jgi:hypothetical protein
MKRVVIKDLDGFMNHVFGADSFIQNFPELQTTGVWVHNYPYERRQYNYIVNAKGIPVNDSSFFTGNEMRYLTVVEEKQ